MFAWKRASPPSRAGPFFGEISQRCEILRNIYFPSRERARSPKRDLAIDQPRSRLGGLEISYVSSEGLAVLERTRARFRPARSARKLPRKSEVNSAHSLGLALPRVLVRLHINSHFEQLSKIQRGLRQCTERTKYQNKIINPTVRAYIILTAFHLYISFFT